MLKCYKGICTFCSKVTKLRDIFWLGFSSVAQDDLIKHTISGKCIPMSILNFPWKCVVNISEHLLTAHTKRDQWPDAHCVCTDSGGGKDMTGKQISLLHPSPKILYGLITRAQFHHGFTLKLESCNLKNKTFFLAYYPSMNKHGGPVEIP